MAGVGPSLTPRFPLIRTGCAKGSGRGWGASVQARSAHDAHAQGLGRAVRGLQVRVQAGVGALAGAVAPSDRTYRP